jgi:triosephosphate isomerase
MEFTSDNYPSNDTTWKFIDQKSILVSKGYQPPFHDFVISTIKNENITEHFLSSKKPLILMISTKLQEAESDNLIKGFVLGNYCKKEGIDFYVVSASVTEEIINTIRK